MGDPARSHTAVSQIKKPMARASRVSLFSRRIEIGLSTAAIDVLFENAQLLSEGQCDGDRFFGSTMLTFDLGQASALLSDDCSAKTLRRLSQLVAEDPRILRRARAIGAEQAHSTAGCAVIDLEIDLTVRIQGTNLHLDLDVEGTAARGNHA